MPPDNRRLVLELDVAAPVRAAVGPTSWFVLESLAARCRPGQPVVEIECNTRDLATVLGLSKDTVARSLRLLTDVEIVRRVDHRSSRSGRFECSAYVVDLAAAGLSVVLLSPPDTVTSDTALTSHTRTHSDPSDIQLSLLH